MFTTKCLARLTMSMLIFVVFAAPNAASAQTYPTKAITIITPWAVGGANDVLVRISAKYLANEFGVPVNIVNKPGGNLVPGILSVLNAAPDGYTLLSESPGSGAGQAIMKDLPYKWDDRMFGPMLTSSPLVFVANPQLPWKTLKDAAEAARANPASFTWGFLGGTANTDISVIQLLDAVGINVSKTKPVPMAGSGPAVLGVAGGHIMFANVGISAVFPLLAAGKLRVLAVTSEKRVDSLPDVMTTREAGFPDVNITTYSGLSGPKGLPKNVVDVLDRAAKKIVAVPAYAKELAGLGNQPDYVSSADARVRVQKQADVYRNALRKLDGGAK